MQKLSQLPKKLDNIGISRIIFDHTEWVTLWGFRMQAGKAEPMDYILSFDRLNKLLRLSGKEGDRLQMLLVERIEKGVEKPSVIDLEELFGKPLFFNQCILEVSSTWAENNAGQWEEDKQCLSIDAVYPLLEKRKQTLSTQTQCRQNLIECEEILAQSYALYLGYMELDMEEEAALQMAGLEDDLKFKMAYYAWKMNEAVA